MYEYINKNLDLKMISTSGQCFRLNEIRPGVFYMMIKNQFIYVENNKYDVTKKMWEEVLYDYLDLETDYEKLNKKIIKLSNDCKFFKNNKDEFLKKCMDNSKGLRILRQDKFEVLISFIISQRKSIKAIKNSIERLCKVSGDKIVNKYGTFYAFPTAKQILNTKIDKLEGCGLGYRVPYVLDAAKKCESSEIELEKYDNLNDEKLVENLMKIKGVGIKVASCAALFGYHRFSVCPIDVWIKRVLDKYYGGKLIESYQNHIGLIQQFWFNGILNNEMMV